ncbi:hypothetical protein SISSUDRAFT_1066955 [Sistotremastrum suecicum HHB10207 ss-3]|uniref:Uncharacterized protein n=1 Tax=Sistotremastrum suecicum HHB10207 ss-3 TaxID=1314776 RepID=A0A165XPF8_9AGAM|nr:hypothetical protein SISSUDRAFT_1066955 [Sistotremastrum suecicum HHB10207 ss-3]
MPELDHLIQGSKTKVILQSFSDRVLILVTQRGKVGNLIQASIPPTTPLISSEDVSSAVHLTPLLGAAPSAHLHTLHALYATQIASQIWLGSRLGADRRPVVVGIALNRTKSPSGTDKDRDDDDLTLSDEERSTFQGVMDMVKEILTAASNAPGAEAVHPNTERDL